MSNNHNSDNSLFGLIADFDGDIRTLYEETHRGSLPVLPLRNMVLFPGVVAPIAVTRESSKALIQWAQEHGPETFIAVATQVDPNVQEPTLADLFPCATLAKILKVFELPNDKYNIILQAFGRVELEPTPTRVTPFLRCRANHLTETLPDVTSREWNALYDTFHETTIKYLEANEEISQEAAFAVKNIHNPFFFVNFVATNLPVSVEDKILLLDISDIEERTTEILRLIHRELRYIELRQNIQEKTRHDLDKQQREFFLQQQIRNIQTELGNGDSADVIELRKRRCKLTLPPQIHTLFEKEITKLERQNPASPDYNVIYTYLDTILSIPWATRTDDNMDLRRATRILDSRHYGMEKVKERILEYLAVMRFSKRKKAPILCLYGPPGVGKTSLCKSIAESLGRKYTRMSLGGIHDESEIRGHRRTYIGAMCGRIMKNVIRAGSTNPVFVLDEIDKVTGQTHNGDPQSALLELLDPEQNGAFHDNYLDFDFDLSDVFFIATANNVSNIPAPLRDRMEMIEVEGYITEEKQEIVRKHLLPDALAPYRFPCSVKMTPAAIEYTIERYTRESGVRQLQKMIEKIVRKVLLEQSSQETDAITPRLSLKPADVTRYLGTPRFSRDSYQPGNFAGVVTGLAWTSVGGEILMIETSLSRSRSPRMTTTGNLGDVMKESAALAFEYVKAHAAHLAVDPRVFEHWNLHVHVPEGATPKDGPSAGITIATSIASAFTQRVVRPRLAMTGEITLRGRVLPVGGIKEKILAAKRAGITDIILSEENRKDIIDIPAKYLKGVSFHYVHTVTDVWDIALLPELVEHPLDLTQALDTPPAPVEP